jgi:2',3'-cyclic-nucleotide 2'-phosphodiesterase (5'-nucleotidase family)
LVGPLRPGKETKGRLIVDAMNLMGYDAMALGPNELSLGESELRQRIAEARFAILSANAYVNSTGARVVAPYVVETVGGYRVALIGLTRPPDPPLPGFDVRDPGASLAAVLPEAADHADFVVLLTNLDFWTTVALTSVVAGIDVAVAGLPSEEPSGPEAAPGTGTLVVTAERPSKAPVTSGRRVGRLVLEVAADGSLRAVDWGSRWLDAELADDPTMSALLQSYGW